MDPGEACSFCRKKLVGFAGCGGAILVPERCSLCGQAGSSVGMGWDLQCGILPVSEQAI